MLDFDYVVTSNGYAVESRLTMIRSSRRRSWPRLECTALADFDLPSSIKTAGSTRFGSFHGLAVEDGSRGSFASPRVRSRISSLTVRHMPDFFHSLK